MKLFRKINEEYWRNAIAADFLQMYYMVSRDQDWEAANILEFVIFTIRKIENDLDVI